MRSLLRLFLLNAMRSTMVAGSAAVTLALLVGGLAVALGVQVYAGSHVRNLEADERTAQAVVGWAIVASVIVSALLAPSSARLPRQLADVAWLYTTPIALSQMALATAVWHGGARVAIWLAAGIGIDVASLLRTGTFGEATLRALIGMPTIAALTFWALGTGSLRGRRAASSVSAAFAGVAGTAALVVILRAAVREESLVAALESGLPGVLAEGLGGSLLASPTLAGSLIVAGIFAAGLALIVLAPGPKLREVLVVDASFWAEFAPGRAGPTTARSRRRSSWNGGGSLVGPGAFLWFEIATLRRAGFPTLSYGALIGVAVLVGRWDAGLLVLFIALIVGSAMLAAPFSGAPMHLRRGDLVVLPGRIASKAAAAELPHALAAGLTLALALFAGGVAAGWSGRHLVGTLALGLGALAVAFGVRLLAAALSYPPRPSAAPSALFLTVLGLSFLGAVLMYALVRASQALHLGLGPLWFAAVAGALGAAMWIAGLRLLDGRTASGQTSSTVVRGDARRSGVAPSPSG